SVSRSRGRARELAVLAAGAAAGAALAWAGATVHGRIGTAGEVAIARLAGTAADTVVAEWERMLRAEERPVAPAGEVFRWTTDPSDRFGVGPDDRPAPAEPPLAPADDVGPSVFETLLVEAERLELVEDDLEGALELVQEALTKDAGSDRLAEGWLRALQLGAHLGRPDVVRENWERLQSLANVESDAAFGLPVRVLAWLALPPETRATVAAESVVTREELERLLLAEDRLTLGTPEEPETRFELSPTLACLLEDMGLDPPSLERRTRAALEGIEALPRKDVVEHRWLCTELAQRPFFMRRDGGNITGFLYATRALEEALSGRAGLPAGFALDFDGDDETLGAVVRARTELPGSPHAFTLRHADPGRIAREESSRLRLLRGALFALAFLCAGGGW